MFLAVLLAGSLAAAAPATVAFGYDGPSQVVVLAQGTASTATTPGLKTRIDAQSTRPSPQSVSQASTSSISPRLATKGGTTLEGGVAGAAKACGLKSFSGDTRVLMADGTSKPIAKLKVGDWILAADPVTGLRAARQVVHGWVHDDTLLDLKIGDGSVTTTVDHPFWNATDGQWEDSSAFDLGDDVLTADGNRISTGGFRAGSVRAGMAYNLTVDDLHTYFVAAGGQFVLVHNAGCGPRFAPGRWLPHFEKHADEFGYKTSVEYLQGARDLVARQGIETFTRTNGDRLFYDAARNEFATMRPNGVLRTYFRPDRGMDYWRAQTGG